MKTKLKEEKVFKDPVHKYIYVQDRLIWDLINTKEFQRLRRIRQLGTTFQTFHGAEHSRFSHSLGVYEITRKIISQFERHYPEDWPAEHRMLCLCAALLHDVGHGPFSHSMEAVFAQYHEVWSCSIIQQDTEINEVLRQYSSDFPRQVAKVIQRADAPSAVTSLISSQLDADRMDYLLRDAYFTGVNYGTFDLERILRLLRPYQNNIVIKDSGMHAVEDYLMSRYQMHWQVYFHPVTRSSEIILQKVFRRAKQLYEDHYQFAFMLSPLRGLFENRMNVTQYLQLDEALLQTALMQWCEEKDPILSDLCRRFIHRRLFKYMTMEKLEQEKIETIQQGLFRVNMDPDYYFQLDSLAELSYDLYQPDADVPIYLLDEQDHLSEISEKSEMIRSISGIGSNATRLFYPAEIL